MSALKWLGVALVLIAAVLAGAVAYGNARWKTLTDALNTQLDAARVAPTPALYDAARELEGLPAPVQRYFRAALTDGVPIVAAASASKAACSPKAPSPTTRPARSKCAWANTSISMSMTTWSEHRSNAPYRWGFADCPEPRLKTMLAGASWPNSYTKDL